LQDSDTAQKRWHFHTREQAFSLTGIESEIAKSITNNNWSPFIPALMEDETWSRLPEVLNDSHMILQFTSGMCSTPCA
jgi:hypothetical protein